MSVWTVLAIGALSLLTISALVALSIGAILGHISRQVTELHDFTVSPGLPSPSMTVLGMEQWDAIERQRPGALRPRVTNPG